MLPNCRRTAASRRAQPLAAGGQLVGLCGKARRDEPGRELTLWRARETEAPPGVASQDKHCPSRLASIRSPQLLATINAMSHESATPSLC
jgi:hypothetical protein